MSLLILHIFLPLHNHFLFKVPQLLFTNKFFLQRIMLFQISHLTLFPFSAIKHSFGMFNNKIFLLQHIINLFIFKLFQIQIIGLIISIKQNLRSQRNRRKLNLRINRNNKRTFHLLLNHIQMK